MDYSSHSRPPTFVRSTYDQSASSFGSAGAPPFIMSGTDFHAILEVEQDSEELGGQSPKNVSSGGDLNLNLGSEEAEEEEEGMFLQMDRRHLRSNK